MFTLNIETSGAAFTIESNDESNGDPYAGPELARLLRKIADEIDGETLAGGDRGTIVDINGHTVGTWSVTDG